MSIGSGEYRGQTNMYICKLMQKSLDTYRHIYLDIYIYNVYCNTFVATQ